MPQNAGGAPNTEIMITYTGQASRPRSVGLTQSEPLLSAACLKGDNKDGQLVNHSQVDARAFSGTTLAVATRDTRLVAGDSPV